METAEQLMQEGIIVLFFAPFHLKKVVEARYGLSGLYLHMRHYEQAGAMWASLALCLCVRWV